MHRELEELARRFELDKDVAFQDVNKKGVFILTYDDPFRFHIDGPTQVGFSMPKSPNPSDSSGVGAITLGYEFPDRITGENKREKKAARFLALLQLANKFVKNTRVSTLLQLVLELQKPHSATRKRFLEQIGNSKVSTILFRYKGQVAFEQSTPEGKWWVKEYDNQFHQAQAATTGSSLFGLDCITLNPDMILRIHDTFPATKLNGKGAALFSRNTESSQELSYEQSEAARIGLVSGRRMNLALNALIDQNQKALVPGLKNKHVCHTERYKDKIVYDIYFSSLMGEELDVVHAIMDDRTPDESYDSSLEYIAAMRQRLKGKSDPDDSEIKANNIVIAQILETKGRASLVDYRSIPVTQAIANVEQWFTDLSITGFKGQKFDWFTIYALRDACWNERERKAEKHPSHISANSFLTAALNQCNIRPSLIDKVLYTLTTEMRSDEMMIYRLYARIALIKLFLIRRGHKISPDLKIEGKVPRSYWLGAIYGTFEDNYTHAKSLMGENVKNEFHARFLSDMLHNPAKVLPALLHHFAVYGRKLDTPPVWKLAGLFTHITEKDFGPMNSQDQMWFFLGWHAVHTQKKTFDIAPVKPEPYPLGALLATYYRQYKIFSDRQGNPNAFILTYLSTFFTHTRRTVAKLQNNAEQVWSKKADPAVHGFCEKTRKLIIENNPLPESIPVRERGLIIQGFFAFQGEFLCPRS